jgi:hypothetical protein
MPFNVAIYASLVCAFVMIGGGMLLLARGVIQLSSAGKSEEGLTIEILDKFKVKTGYPALGLFVIGLCCIVLAIYFSKPSDILSLSIAGKLDMEEPNLATVKVVPDGELGVTFTPDSDGDVTRTLHPEFAVQVVINTPGYKPSSWKKTLVVTKGKPLKIDLPKDLKFKKAGPAPEKGQTIPLPPNVNAPPVQEATGFKPSS